MSELVVCVKIAKKNRKKRSYGNEPGSTHFLKVSSNQYSNLAEVICKNWKFLCCFSS